MVDTWVEEAGVPAVAAAVVGPEGVRHARLAGEARPGHLFALASLTKPIVALAVLVAAEEGALELDEPVGRHLAAYASGPRAAVTARHLLSHASGLPESGPAGAPALEVELARPPATRRVYSNVGYAVLGELIAAATGTPHPDYVRRAVFEPLGMDAYLGLPEHEDARALRVREPGMWRPGVQLFNSTEWRRRATAAGGAFSTLDAYARIVQVLLSGGAPLIAPATAADMARAQFPGLPGGIESFQTWEVADWGLGCDIRDGKSPHWLPAACSPATLSHLGAAGTLMWADPVARVGLVCLANRGTYSGWMMQPGGWIDLSDAVLEAAS
jgi:CubicO group peptidase (beta-lactamase class C family)